jgi:molybdopterin-guanine dinucleotide biosynthesis protein A
MGYLNKGLQPFCGSTLIEHVLTRLKVQVGPLVINANKDLDRYASLGLDIWSDANKSVGPLSGFLTGLTRASTPYLMVTPCDTPLLPMDLVERMFVRLEQTHSDLCMPVTRDTPNEESRWFKQPAFCLMKKSLAQSLADFLASGQTKIQAWATLHRHSLVEFDSPPYDARSFVNVNTLEQLRSLELELQKN